MAPTKRDYSAGRARLREFLPLARKKARELYSYPEPTGLAPQTMLAMSFLRHLSEQNLDSLVVYQRAPGQWHADVILKSTPAGVPNAFGTPADCPSSTREEAERGGFDLLVKLCLTELEHQLGSRDMQEKDIRVFRLYDMEFSIPGELVDKLESIGRFPAPQRAERILVEALADLCNGSDFSEQIYQAAAETTRLKILGGMVAMLACNRFRYPEAGAARRSTAA